jgi:hypothetical protein
MPEIGWAGGCRVCFCSEVTISLYDGMTVDGYSYSKFVSMNGKAANEVDGYSESVSRQLSEWCQKGE